MPSHCATIRWKRDGGDFHRGRYSRAHTWEFDGGITVPASPSPSVVPLPFSDEAAIDPEEALVAAIASCHMLTFLHLASKAEVTVEAYDDVATGTLAKNAEGRWWVERVVLQPEITFAGTPPTAAEIEALHHAAHEECFIANSVRTEVTVEPPA